MVKGMSHMENWAEVAPSPYVVKHRRYSTCPKLETIFEEGYQRSRHRRHHHHHHSDQYFNGINTTKMVIMTNVDVRAPKRVVYILPVFIAMVAYYFLFRNIS